MVPYKKIIIEKPHRLAPEKYFGKIKISLTANIKERKHLFVTQKVFKHFENVLIGEADVFKCSLYIYLFMPDHLHLIFGGKEESTDNMNYIKMFKQKTGFWLSQNMNEFKWQKNFYDHVIRCHKDFENQMRYVLRNPIKGGLIDDWMDYPFMGSAVYNNEELKKLFE